MTLLLALLGCGSPPAPAPAPAPASQPTTSGDATASPAADLVPGSLCLKTEKVKFACTAANGKTLSLCASADLAPGVGFLRYRFGRPGATELEYPGDGAPSAFHYALVSYARSQAYEVTFQNGDVAYTVYDQDSLGTESDHGSGVNVEKVAADGSRTPIANVSCADGSTTLALDTLDGVVPNR